MIVDIWSDVRCPFCYIGKRKFENALKDFNHKEKVTVYWHSFQLDPGLKTDPEVDIIEYFTEAKGVSKEQAMQMFKGARKMAEDAGLQMNPEKTVLANSAKSHELLQFAKSKNRGNEIKEGLFEAHFNEAKNIDDLDVLVQVGVSSGLDRQETRNALESGEYKAAVKKDEMAAQEIGIRGVPFFVFNKKYAVSGAQPEETFLEILEKVWKEIEEKEKPVILKDGDSCGTNGCD